MLMRLLGPIENPLLNSRASLAASSGEFGHIARPQPPVVLTLTVIPLSDHNRMLTMHQFGNTDILMPD